MPAGSRDPSPVTTSSGYASGGDAGFYSWQQAHDDADDLDAEDRRQRGAAAPVYNNIPSPTSLINLLSVAILTGRLM